ncbi:peptidoglycan DD-metalloendopeptidase family protein [Rossellomorea aquimaris]|uniref:peptidoglycan DD-metalloendopeptidase family protein n=1 Tax=Rossellomorea TaxID=2837508 RepID=UPI001CD45EAA|nr:peptidoglycan DD-metalloendopeptidase family protein [Rossellomorea aquimaris]MCA1058282.1 peptidoglycan DD-metalloendopeptidase family protein [Rossellomorea aquimaris]
MISHCAKRLFIVWVLCVSVMLLSGHVSEAEEDKVSEETVSWTFPVEGMITDSYGTRSGSHKGMDIGGELGSPVYSVAKGIVIRSYLSESYGHVVFVRHENGYETVYAHLKSRKVHENQEVEQGEQLGLLGNTGRSTGAHLHFEIHRGEWTFDKENAIDPYRVFGNGEVGQLVFAKEKDPYQTVGVAGTPEGNMSRDTKHEVMHIVHKGETLWGISQTYEVSVEDILKENALKSTELVINQLLRIPASLPSDQYEVKKGDTLYSISMAHGIDVEELADRNGLDMQSAIFPEQVLIVQ